MFYTFRQNNSGGSFDRDNNVDVYVVVEGADIPDVIERAENIGIYFNGVRKGYDCECCGDRWYKPWDGEELDAVPSIYSEPIDEMWDTRTKGCNTVIHFADGTRKYAGG